MFKCNEENREIPLDSLVYIVEHPYYGAKVRLFIGEPAMKRVVNDKRCEAPFKGKQALGLNVYSCWVKPSGRPRRGRFLFSVPAVALLTTLPETFHTYWDFPK